MIKDVKRLVIFNLISYINCFLFSACYALPNDKLLSNWGILVIWVLTPYVFMIITSFILATDNKKEYKIFKKQAIVDWIVRFISLCVVFQQWNFKFLSFEYIIEQIIVLVLFAVNIILEIIMYNKALRYVPTNDDIIEKISENEKFNIKNMGRACTKGLKSFIAFSCFMGVYIATMSSPKNIFYQLFIMAALVGVFLWFIRENIEKCNLFYLDKKLADRVSKNDSFYALAGFFIFIFGVLWIPQSYFPLSTLPQWIQIFFLYPTIQTNRKIALRYKVVSKVLRDSDTFDLYYDYED